jgi:hypothetical protein
LFVSGSQNLIAVSESKEGAFLRLPINTKLPGLTTKVDVIWTNNGFTSILESNYNLSSDL